MSTPEDDVTAAGFDPALAAALIDQETARIRRALDVGMPVQAIAWGVAWMVGLGVMWWQVRDQAPYVGASDAASGLFAVLLLLAGLVTVVLTRRGTQGVAGAQARKGQIYGILWGGGFGGLMALIFAVARTGAGPDAMTVLSTAGSLLMAGLVYVAGSGLWGSRPQLVLGSWMLLVGAVAGFLGPVGVLAAGAFAGGGAMVLCGIWLLVAGRR